MVCRKYIGIDIEKEYLDLTVKRFYGAGKNLENKNSGLFETAKPKKPVKKTKQEMVEFEQEILDLVPEIYRKR